MTAPKLRYSELTHAEVCVLRICASLEPAYPESAEAQGDKRASAILAGYEAWRARSAASPAERLARPRDARP